MGVIAGKLRVMYVNCLFCLLQVTFNFRGHYIVLQVHQVHQIFLPVLTMKYFIILAKTCT